MADSHRFHLDLGGHSVTVHADLAPGETELLVDGKVVGHQRRHGRRRESTTTLAAELPGEPPQPFTVSLDRSGDGEQCVLETGGRRYPMPADPLPHAWKPARTGPLTRLRRRMRRLVRRLVRRLSAGRSRRR